MKTTLALILTGLLAAAAQAQENYPLKSVEAIVGYAAGGTADIVMRELANRMGEDFPEGVLVVNKPGAGGGVGLASVANGKSDGYTFAIAPNSNLALTPQVLDVGYDGPDAVTPVINIVGFSPVLVVRGDSPYQTLQDLVDAAKEAPSSITVGLPGVANISDFNIINLEAETGAVFNRVPFAGWGQTSGQLLGGHIQAAVAQPPEVIALVESGDLRVLASFSEERQQGLEDSPTAKEQGFPTGFDARYLIAVANDTPETAIQHIHDSVKRVMDLEEFKNFVAERGMTIKYMNGQQTAEENRRDFEKYKEILAEMPPTK